MNFRNRKVSLIIFVLTVFLLLGGCQSNDSANNTTTSSPNRSAFSVHGSRTIEPPSTSANQSTTTAVLPKQPSSNKVELRGDKDCRTLTQTALDLLKSKAPIHYETVNEYVGSIDCVNEGSGVYSWEKPPRVIIGDATRNASLTWYASVLVHEATHARLYQTYEKEHPGESVPEDVYSGENGESICIQVQYDALTLVGGPQYELDHLKNSLETRYWEIPYEDRWW